MKGELEFKPSARLQYILSEELVSDPNVAVLEFVKNAYDADAIDVLISFDLDRDRRRSRLIVADDGQGMDYDEFERNWMHPGYSAKVGAGPTSMKRVPVGEKGLGRLAAGRLGETLDVYTRRRKKDKWVHARFRWSDFNDMNRDLHEIKIPWDDESEPPVEGVDTGTVIEITGLKLRWDTRVPGRKVKGRATTRLGRLRQDLEVLLLPLTAGGQQFAINLEHDSELHEDEDGYVVPPTMKLLDYEYAFEVKQIGKDWKIKRTIRRSPTEASRLGVKLTETRTTSIEELSEAINLDAVGPFSGTFYYAPRSASQLRALRAPTGVRIYRDDVRIDPYGDPEDDWLGASARKAIRQGHAAIQPNSLYGAVKISKENNPDLKPLANREGLIDNDALEAFLTFARHEFAEFGDLIQREYLDPKWREQQARKSSQKAFDSTQWAKAITRAAAHAVRQPISGADTELSRLQRTIQRSDDIPSKTRARLQELHDRTREHLQRIDEAIDKMLGFLEFDPEPVEVDVSELVADTLDRVTSAARSAHVTLTNSAEDPITARVPLGLVEHALEELLENAIRAERPEGRRGEVIVEAHRDNGVIRLRVIDNGSGIPPEIDEKLFKQTVSAGGHVGVGLMWNKQLLQVARGDIERVSTGPAGTRFDMILPEMPTNGDQE